ncbi:TRPL translocation defect protein 14-like [Aphis craccivora]|uniref:TRPL translocation defect protein 14-like n=1 Tax=Aphis craccivora TaxID=307492 RepID=A0A6G0YPM6_APHCR|nr:TRPL translocation defect protein 14-like [Aphis craccivora]
MSTLECIANELHRPARKAFPKRSIITRFQDDLWQADLMDMQFHSKQNLGFKYILVFIDTICTNTKYVWVETLKNKTGKEYTKEAGCRQSGSAYISVANIRPSLHCGCPQPQSLKLAQVGGPSPLPDDLHGRLSGSLPADCVLGMGNGSATTP